ncbi:MAG: PEP-CTERM sorting domain-containing protein [Phycisphaerales bacterium]|nr:PEP-CTERM sorting domain-containing protein [Phycisphaerales bacterium]
MKTSALILVIAAAGAANADPVIWNNNVPADTLLSSQLDTAYPFDSQVADDFMFTDMGYYVTDVHWTGGFWGGDPLNPIAFNIYFYADDGTGNFPTTPVPTSALAIYHFDSVTGTPNGTYYDYSVDLPTDFTANVNTKYWIAIQGEHFFPPQYGMACATSQVYYGSNAKQGFPLLGMPYWTDPGYGDMVFSLTGVPIPAPASIALLGLGALTIRRRR